MGVGIPDDVSSQSQAGQGRQMGKGYERERGPKGKIANLRN